MKKVLIADDHLVSRSMLQTILEKNGYTVSVAQDGLEAWQRFQAEPDNTLAVLDWMMPGIDGVELCRKIRTEHPSRVVHIILLTAKGGTENLACALEAGANDYITKPFKKDELLARLGVGERMIRLQQQLLQSQKLESVGHLAAGIAHEINTPAQYGDNAHFLRNAFEDVLKLLKEYGRLLEVCRNGASAAGPAAEIETLLKQVDLHYLLEEIPACIRQTLDGVNRVSHIVSALKAFGRPGVEGKTKIDLNQALKETLIVTGRNWKGLADLQTDFDPNLPAVSGRAAELNMVFFNLIMNAAEAVSGALPKDSDSKGVIKVATRPDNGWAEVRISDTGPGIPGAIREKIFNPFFTTKKAGAGVGQGLSVAHAIVAKGHGGTIYFETEPGKGTTFIVRLPGEPGPNPSCGGTTRERQTKNLICG